MLNRTKSPKVKNNSDKLSKKLTVKKYETYFPSSTLTLGAVLTQHKGNIVKPTLHRSSLSCLRPKFWKLVAKELKKLSNISAFTKAMKKWKPQNSHVDNVNNSYQTLV